MKIKFVCRESKARKNGESPLELSIIINGERKIITLDRSCKASAFNPSTQKVRGDKELNEYLAAITKKCYSVHTAMINEGMNITLQSFLDVYRNGLKKNIITIANAIDECSTTKASDVVVKRMMTVKKFMLEYLDGDKPLDSITPNTCNGFYQFLCEKQSNNSAVAKMKLLKTVLQYCVDEGYIKTSPFKCKLHLDKVEHHPLTMQQIQTIQNKVITNKRLANVRDLFVFQCFTGLAYCDMASLNKQHIVDGYIIKSRNKTKVTSTIPLLDNALNILEKYDYQLPVLSNQKYNSYLKELGDICNIQQDITSHLARHSFATLMLNNGVQMHTISKVLGHSSTKITESTYAQLRKETIGNEVLKLNSLI